MKSFKKWGTFSEGEARFIDSLEIGRLQKWILPLIGAFTILGFVDVSMTVAALNLLKGAAELNPIAASIFRLGFAGSMIAIGLKFAVPLPTMMYIATLKQCETPHETREVKILKAALIASLIFGVAWWGFAVAYDTASLAFAFLIH
ncbi:MAG: hypothetical protein JRN68_00035 [Nitrososphaerota archaeon]|nr:hypothetical protein [Nitrososphaerota archaeon]